MKRLLLALVVAVFLLGGCATTLPPGPGTPAIQQVPLEELTPQQQLTIGWQAYNKIYEDYERMILLKDPSTAEIKVMNWEYELLNRAWPILKAATEGFEEGQSLGSSVLEVIQELARNVRF